jgi:nucleotide-binding universal stress UspA family protein
MLARASRPSAASRPAAAASTDDDPVEALARYAESVDLLVLGSHAYHPTDALLAGSTAQRLADQAPCPLLVLARERVTPAG